MRPSDLHPLLQRQLRKSGLAGETLPANWQAFLQTISQSYHDGDLERKMLERSLDLSSTELLGLNRQLEQRVAERTNKLKVVNQALLQSNHHVQQLQKIASAANPSPSPYPAARQSPRPADGAISRATR